ncbi:hypothetical protein [Massilia sp. CF038]|uniref:hypothetical protein n=1 Tax=Massilia sp. CF038 TaxID=1881045 RepID=UPI00091E2B99|nr:hypothetical protein [Massilia sp. CF038]SHH10470.1 hypothetical protein SAMN05428948_2792 [Massilia sp. CF038]
MADILLTPDEGGYYCLTRELPPETMRQLAQLSALEPLKLSITKIAQFGVGHARCLAGLRVQQLWIWCDVTRAAMNHILQLEGLRELDILCMSGPGKLKNFHKAVQLEVFRANHYMTEPDLLQVAQCKSIRVLGAQNADLTQSAFAALLSMPNLTALDLEATRFDDKMARKISRSTTVTSLDVGGTRLTRAGLAHLMKMTQLQSLDLWALDLNATDLTILLTLPNLEYVSFGGNDNAPPLDAGAITTLILGSHSLKRVWLEGIPLEVRQREALEVKLEYLHLSN